MTHSYTVAGITCEGCVAKVKSKLLAHQDILSAEVILKGQKAIVTMQKHLNVEELQAAIGVNTKYKISADNHYSGHSMKIEENRSWLITYKPLLLIVAFISGVALLNSHGSLHAGMNVFMTGFFLVFSFFKLLNLKGFADSYAMYDVLAIKVPMYGYIYPFVELALGISFLTGFNPVVTNWATIIVMSLSSIGVIQSVMNKKKIQCACLGAVFNLPMSTVTIIEDLLMVAMAILMVSMY